MDWDDDDHPLIYKQPTYAGIPHFVQVYFGMYCIVFGRDISKTTKLIRNDQ